MDRLHGWLLVLAVLALAACSGVSPADGRNNAGQNGLDGPDIPGAALTEEESAELMPPTPVPAEVAALLTPVKAPAGLPPLPPGLFSAKLPAATEQSFKDGNLSWGASPNATDDGTTNPRLDRCELAWASMSPAAGADRADHQTLRHLLELGARGNSALRLDVRPGQLRDEQLGGHADPEPGD
jgi:hypothetical protein